MLKGSRLRARADLAAGIARATLRIARHTALPFEDGRIPVRGPRTEVEVVRDAHGVPHILAATDADVLFGQGFVHAQDRLFQMESARRFGGGRLAEITGSTSLRSDRFMRRVGLHRAAAREVADLPLDQRALLEAYAAGVNEGVRTLPELPPEFAVFGDFQPWRAADSILVARLLLFSFGGNWDTELLRERLLAALGPERASAVDPVHPVRGTVTGVAHLDGTPAFERLINAYRDASTAGPLRGGASNAWAIDGARTVTGAPLLAADPHVEVRIPGIFHVAHLVGGTIDAIGADIPGVPGVLIGHTQHFAWGITAGMADIADCYVETLDPRDWHRYRTPGGWTVAEEIVEAIAVRGEPTVEERVLITRHGPVVGPALPGESRAIALRSTALEAGNLLDAALGMLRATTVSEFEGALERWPGGAFNFVYAHPGGATGYVLAGSVPRRAPGEGLLPRDGATSPGAPVPWPGAMLPRAHGGIIVSANQAPGGQLELGEEWCEPQRADRIRALLAATSRHDVASCAAVQHDRHSAHLVRLRDLLIDRGVVARPELPLLIVWDGQLRPDSPGAAVVQAIYRELARTMAQRVAGPMASTILGRGLDGVSTVGSFHFRAQGMLIGALESAAAPWFEDEADRDRQLAGAAARAIEALQQTHGRHADRWTWGAMHRLTFRHPLAASGVPGLRRMLSRGPYPVGGDVNTVNQNAEPLWVDDATRNVFVTAGYRQVIDCGDWDQSRFMLPTGNSGVPGHPRYDDCIAEFLAGETRPLLYSRTAVESAAHARLVLAPLRLEPTARSTPPATGAGGPPWTTAQP